jgi:ATP adenylyltransferase
MKIRIKRGVMLIIFGALALQRVSSLDAMEPAHEQERALENLEEVPQEASESSYINQGSTLYCYTPWRNAYRRARDSNEQRPTPACIFCDQISRGDDINYGIIRPDRNFIVMNNALPYAHSGSLMVIPLQHVPDLYELGTTLRATLASLLRRISRAMLDILGYQGFSLGINTGKVAGASIPEHMHMHLIPALNPGQTPGVYSNLVEVLMGKPLLLPDDTRPLYHEIKQALEKESFSGTALDRARKSNTQADRCTFCSIIAGQGDEKHLVIIRLKHCLIMFNATPLVRGSMIIVPYEHQASLDLFAEEVINEMLEACAQLTNICPELLRNQGSNMGITIGRQLNGRPADHMGMDFMPRWTGDISSLALSDTQVISLDIVEFRKMLKDKLEERLGQELA